MKKGILILAALFVSVFGYSQKVNIINTVAATTTVTAYTADLTPQIGQMGNGITGNIHIITSSAFNGTTSTDSLFVSLNGTDWAIMKDDNGAPIVFTMSAGANIYPVKIISAPEPFYKIKYSKGNATLGTVKAIIFLR